MNFEWNPRVLVIKEHSVYRIVLVLLCSWSKKEARAQLSTVWYPKRPRSLRWKLSSSWKYPVVMAHIWMACHSKHRQLEFISDINTNWVSPTSLPILFTKFWISDGALADISQIFSPQQFMTNWLQSTSWIARHDPRKQYFSHHLGFDRYLRGHLVSGK